MRFDFDRMFPTVNEISACGILRKKPKDFKVTEINDIHLSGTGEHLWLYKEKTGSNTDWVAKQLSNICQVPQRNVAYAGLKDRQAVTQQWFSVQLPKISDRKKIQSALPDNVSILKSDFHSRKIKRGQLQANRFEIVIREIEGDLAGISNNIEQILQNGVPNYFGNQRFGSEMGNIQKCQDWFAGNTKVKSKNLKSLLISTARSHIFNEILASRINNGSWNKPMLGDIVQLDGSHSWFHCKDASTKEIEKRIKQFDVHITAAMYGENQVQSTEDCAFLENKIAKKHTIYHIGFEHFRLKQDRRSMRIIPRNFKFDFRAKDLFLQFELSSGSYATGVIREIVKFQT